jgi:hypothetical protein
LLILVGVSQLAVGEEGKARLYFADPAKHEPYLCEGLQFVILDHQDRRLCGGRVESVLGDCDISPFPETAWPTRPASWAASAIAGIRKSMPRLRYSVRALFLATSLIAVALAILVPTLRRARQARCATQLTVLGLALVNGDSVRVKRLPPQTVRALLTADGGEQVFMNDLLQGGDLVEKAR